METMVTRNKLAFLAMAAAIGLAAPAASAANPHQAPSGAPFQDWQLVSQVTKVTVVDRSLQSTADTYVQIDLTTPGTVCGTTSVGVIYILRSDHPEQFDNWVRLAQSAYLSGRKINYVSAKKTSTGNCFTWYMSLRD